MNHSTQTILQWKNNDEGSYNGWQADALAAWNDAQAEGPTSRSAVASSALALTLRDEVQEEMPQPGGFWQDFLVASFQEIDFQEIAHDLIEDVKTDSDEDEDSGKPVWVAVDISEGSSLPIFEFKDQSGEWHNFDLIATSDKIVFGGPTNNSFLQSGYIDREEGESLDETLQEMVADLETFYNDGAPYVSRIVVNECM